MTTEEMLLSAADAAPSKNAWEALCAACDAQLAHDAARFEALLPQLSEALAGWPDHERPAPQAWFDEAAAGRRAPALQLVRVLQRGAMEDMEDHSGAPPNTLRALGAPELAQVTRLNLDALGIREVSSLRGASMLGAVRVLGTASWPDQGDEAVFGALVALEELTLHSSKPVDFIKAFKRAGRLAGLERLSLWTRVTRGLLRELAPARKLRSLSIWRDNGFDDAQVAVLCEALKRAPLKGLQFYNCGVTEEARQVIARAGCWQLEALELKQIPWLKR
jgi:hypothetical protein